MELPDGDFLDLDWAPVPETDGAPAPLVMLCGRGGHVGFVAGSPWRPLFWAEETAAAYLDERLLGASGPAAERD